MPANDFAIPTDATGQTTPDPVGWKSPRLGAGVHRRSQSGTRSESHTDAIDSREHRHHAVAAFPSAPQYVTATSNRP
jgi:hypothetical protein